MNNNNLPLAIALAAAFLGAAPHAAAAALGEVAVLSAMGESFRAEIRLPGATRADAECFRVVAAPGGEFPSLRQGRVAIAGSGADARLVVHDAARVGEPVLKLVIENVCESRLRREYTLLMPFGAGGHLPATAAPAAAPPASPSSRAPRQSPAAGAHAGPPADAAAGPTRRPAGKRR